jgi:hypothetical protein
MDSILRRVQTKLEEVRQELETRAVRTAQANAGTASTEGDSAPAADTTPGPDVSDQPGDPFQGGTGV